MKIQLSSHMHAYTQKQGEVEANGLTLAEVLGDLDKHYPGLRFRLIDEQDRIREHIKIYLNAHIIHTLNHNVLPSDTVQIIGALSGG